LGPQALSTARVKLEWWGADSAGRFSAASAATSPDDIGLARGRPSIWPLALGRSAALIRVCSARCVLLWAKPNAPMTQVDQALGLEAGLGVTTERGAVTLGRTISPDGQSTGYATLLISADGRAQGQHALLVNDSSGHLGLFEASGTTALMAPSGRWLELPLDTHSLPSPIPSLHGPLALCREPTPGIQTLVLDSAVDIAGAGLPTKEDGVPVRSIVELGADSACLRAVELWPALQSGRRRRDSSDALEPNGAWRGGRVAAQGGDALVGWIAQGDRRSAVRCQLGNAPTK
ncbi:MAG TPA: hypothetical protein VNG33_17700, partial [Polyangiaceae bacterium]|nr:hypothetical protein [Polyangiaceae bacterium]